MLMAIAQGVRILAELLEAGAAAAHACEGERCRALDAHAVLLLAVHAALTQQRLPSLCLQTCTMEAAAATTDAEPRMPLCADPGRVVRAVLGCSGVPGGAPFPRLTYSLAGVAPCSACGTVRGEGKRLALTALPVFGSLIIYTHSVSDDEMAGGGAAAAVVQTALRTAEFIMAVGTVELSAGDFRVGGGNAMGGPGGGKEELASESTPEHVVSHELGVVVAWRRLLARCKAGLQSRAKQQIMGGKGAVRCASCAVAVVQPLVCQLHSMPEAVLDKITRFRGSDVRAALTRRLRI